MFLEVGYLLQWANWSLRVRNTDIVDLAVNINADSLMMVHSVATISSRLASFCGFDGADILVVVTVTSISIENGSVRFGKYC